MRKNCLWQNVKFRGNTQGKKVYISKRWKTQNRAQRKSVSNHENVKMRAEQVKHLPIVLARLSNDEQRLIDALFFRGLGVREYAREIGVPPMKIGRDRDRILAKLKKYFSNF